MELSHLLFNKSFVQKETVIMNCKFSAMHRHAKLLLSVIGSLSFAFLGLASVTLPQGQVGAPYLKGYDAVTTAPLPVVIGAPDGAVFSATGLPEGVSINQSSGLISGIPTTPGIHSGVITITHSGLSNMFDFTCDVMSASGTFPITNASLYAEGKVGEAFGFPITTDANGEFSLNVGAQPRGIRFNAITNSIEGVAEAAGEYTIALSVNNASGIGPESLLTIKILPAGAVPVIDSALYLEAELNAYIEYSVTALHNPTRYTASGLPVGLTLDESGLVSGTPTAPGVYKVFLNAENGFGLSEDYVLTLVVGALSKIEGQTEFSTFIGVKFFEQLTASPQPLSFNARGLPDGFVFDGSDGTISGTPSEEGIIGFFVSANNELGEGPEVALTIDVGAAGAGAGNSHIAIVRVRESPSYGGRVTGSRSAPIGKPITLRAHANPGYRFDHWEGISVSSETAASSPITFIAEGNSELTAVFEALDSGVQKGKNK